MPNRPNAERWRAECRKEVRSEIKQKLYLLLPFGISALPTVPGRIAHCRRYKSRIQGIRAATSVKGPAAADEWKTAKEKHKQESNDRSASATQLNTLLSEVRYKSVDWN